uniref:SWIM-type domain-containing protein n=1 Tax=Lactuca sativa TaxID=4236 RepID=A0A9R1XK12_LACSA|nr:hypothetical protein LSAT_V11C400164730 [Lactuca sativa]
MIAYTNIQVQVKIEIWGPKFSILYVDKYAPEKSLIELDSNEKFMTMLGMYRSEKQVTIYVTTENNLDTNENTNHLCANRDKLHNEYDADLCPSEGSYHSHLSFDNEEDLMNDDNEVYSFSKNSISMEVGSKFENVVDFRRALNHFTVTNEFNYYIQKSDPTQFTKRCENLECEWRIHASITQDEVTFEVKKMVEVHTCIRSNKGGNKRATQGWIANVVTDKLKSDGDVSPYELRNWIMKTYNVDVSYLKVFRGKEQAYIDMYGKWEYSFMKMDEYKEELLRRNEGRVVEINFDIVAGKKLFRRFFFSSLFQRFSCWLSSEKLNGVLAATIGIDGNNSIFPIAYCGLESENTQSWTWFLDSLKKAIRMPNGLVISSDMQKGLEVAMMNVYPDVEHIRHLYSNFKMHFRGDFLNTKLWVATKTYRSTKNDRLSKEISDKNEDAIAYLNTNHKKYGVEEVWYTSKCDYITNNISETFNSWIGKLRYKFVLDLLGAIREKIMRRFNKKRNFVNTWSVTLIPISKNHLNDIAKGTHWEVNLDERKCSCRVWQVRDRPCLHVATFIAFIRDANWDKYVDPYFTIDKFKVAYAFQIAPMPGQDQWAQKDGEKIYRPIIKRPPRRPRKTELNHQMSLKEDTNVHDVESMDIVNRHVRIQHLRVSIKVKHPHLKGNMEKKYKTAGWSRSFGVYMNKA